MKRLLALFALGILISGFGMILISIGGWGQSGPMDWVARIGGCLNLYHVLFYAMIIGNFSVSNPALNFMLILLIPALHWMVILGAVTHIFGLFPAVRLFKKGKGKRR